jgi:hypothetical protein
MVAEVLHPVVTIPAIPIDAAYPGDAGTAPQRQLCSRPAGYFADYLVTRDEVGAKRGYISFGNVQVGPANSAGENSQQHKAGLQLRTGDLLNLKEWFGRRAADGKDGSLHGISLLFAAVCGEFFAQLVGVSRVLVSLFGQLMSGQMISLFMGDCGSGMGMGGKIMQF